MNEIALYSIGSKSFEWEDMCKKNEISRSDKGEEVSRGSIE